MLPYQLKLSSLEIENYRQYAKAKIDFSTDPKKTFTIVRGVNGAGKTNIMNAITWCLYGKEMYLSREDEDFPIINSHVLAEANEGNIIRMSVQVELADNNGPKFRIQRKLGLYLTRKTNELHRVKEGAIPVDSTPDVKTLFQHYDFSKGGWETSSYFDSSIKKILPEELAGYFLFDGERLEEFFEKIEHIKQGIEDVSQIQVTRNALGHLSKFLSEIRLDIKDLNPQTKEVQEKIKIKQKEIEDLQKINDPLKTKLKTVEKELADSRLFLLQNSDENVSTLQKTENLLKRTIKKERDDLQDFILNKTSYIIRHASGVYLHEVIDKALDRIYQKINKGEIPPKLKQGFLNELLETKDCICGRKLDESSGSLQAIRALQKSASYSKIGDLCSEIKTNLNSIKNSDSIISTLNTFGRKIKTLENSIRTNQKSLDDIAVKLGKINIEQVKKTQEKKVKLEQDEREILSKIAVNNDHLQQAISELNKLNREFDRQTSLKGKHDFESKRIIFCTTAKESLEKVKNELLDDVRKIVQKQTEKYFLKLVWKKNTFSHVSISPEYDIKVTYGDGHPVLTGLSKGEKLILALSFMAALRESAAFVFPLVIDTPLGRVSGEHRNNIAKLLPEFLQDKQVTLLITDTEYQSPVEDEQNQKIFPSVRDTLLPHVGKEHLLMYESTNLTSSVI